MFAEVRALAFRFGACKFAFSNSTFGPPDFKTCYGVQNSLISTIYPSHNMELPRIAIVGAGPAGLTLARLLQNAQIPHTLFELDASHSARKVELQGSLDIHSATGQETLKEAGLLAKFWELSRPEGEEFKMIEPKSLRLIHHTLPPKKGQPNKPEIMRTDLRDMLLDSLHRDSIKWGKKLTKVGQARSGTYDLYFQDGSIEKGFDLVVGSDKAWSRVCRLLISEVPHYLGATWTQFDTPAKDVGQDVSNLIGQGAMATMGDHRMIWLQQYTGRAISTGLGLPVPVTWVNDIGIDFLDRDNAGTVMAEKYLAREKWSDTIRHLLLGSQGEVHVRPLYELPVSSSGRPVQGDAAHVMTIYAGVGANVAMEDSLELAREIIKRKHEGKRAIVLDAVKAYERSMFRRAEKMQP